MNDHFFKIQKTLFWAIFGPFSLFFGKRKVFHEIELLCKTSQGFLTPCQNSEKSNDPVSRKHPNRCQEAKKDRPYFIGSFQIPPVV